MQTPRMRGGPPRMRGGLEDHCHSLAASAFIVLACVFESLLVRMHHFDCHCVAGFSLAGHAWFTQATKIKSTYYNDDELFYDFCTELAVAVSSGTPIEMSDDERSAPGLDTHIT